MSKSSGVLVGLLIVGSLGMATAARAASKKSAHIKYVKIRRGGGKGSYKILTTVKLKINKGTSYRLKGTLTHPSFKSVKFTGGKSFRASKGKRSVTFPFPYADIEAKFGKDKRPQSETFHLEVVLDGYVKKALSAQRIWRQIATYKRELKWPCVRNSVYAANFYNVVMSTHAKAKIFARRHPGKTSAKKKKIKFGLSLFKVLAGKAKRVSRNRKMKPWKKANRLETMANNAKKIKKDYFKR